MNIFYLDHDPTACAQYHGDKHVVKMILETAQLLCSAHHLHHSPADNLYRLTHQNHPSARWVRAAKSHYDWTYRLFVALCQEYTHRYGKVHLTEQKLKETLAFCPITHDDTFSPPPLVMPDEFHRDTNTPDDVVHAYRQYYKTAKADLMVYTNRTPPFWASQ